MIYAMGRRGTTEGGQGCNPSVAGHRPTAAVRIVLPEATWLKFRLRQDLRGETFEGLDGAGFAWELVDLPPGWVQFQQMDRHFWPL